MSNRPIHLLVLLASSTAIAEPTVKPADVATTLEAALAVHVDATTPRGVTTTVALIDKADGVAIANVRAALAKLPVTFVEERWESGVAMMTVQAKSGARGTIAIGPDGGAIRVTLRPAVVKAPGACVAIPHVEHHVDVHSSGTDDRGDHHERTIGWSLDTQRVLDVDGDGLLDVFVPIAATPDTCPELVSYRIYVVRGTCGHDVGVVGPGSFAHDAATVPLGVSGYRPLTMSSQTAKRGPRGLPEMTTATRRFEVANNRYQQVDLKTRGGVCHHCGVWYCRKR